MHARLPHDAHLFRCNKESSKAKQIAHRLFGYVQQSAKCKTHAAGLQGKFHIALHTRSNIPRGLCDGQGTTRRHASASLDGVCGIYIHVNNLNRMHLYHDLNI